MVTLCTDGEENFGFNKIGAICSNNEGMSSKNLSENLKDLNPNNISFHDYQREKNLFLSLYSKE